MFGTEMVDDEVLNVVDEILAEEVYDDVVDVVVVLRLAIEADEVEVELQWQLTSAVLDEVVVNELSLSDTQALADITLLEVLKLLLP